MTPELQRYYDDIFDMFASPGWKAFTEDLERIEKSLLDVRNCKNLDETRGALRELQHVLHAKAIYEAGYASALAGAQDDPGV